MALLLLILFRKHNNRKPEKAEERHSLLFSVYAGRTGFLYL
jgi:hypothetical protein